MSCSQRREQYRREGIDRGLVVGVPVGPTTAIWRFAAAAINQRTVEQRLQIGYALELNVQIAAVRSGQLLDTLQACFEGIAPTTFRCMLSRHFISSKLEKANRIPILKTANNL